MRKVLIHVTDSYEAKRQLTKDDISFEAQIEIRNLRLRRSSNHIDIGACDTIDDFSVGNSLDFFGSFFIDYSVMESVRSSLATVRLLNCAHHQIYLLLAHLILQVC